MFLPYVAWSEPIKGQRCNDIDVIVLFTSGPHLRHNYHGNKTLETMLSGSVEFVGHRLNRPVLLHLCVCVMFFL